jgi:hypothetical protein
MQQSLSPCVLSSHWYTGPNRHLKAITKLHCHFAVAPQIGELLGSVVEPTAAVLLVNDTTPQSLSLLARAGYTNPDKVLVLYICSLHDG